ncbi:malonyl-CoA synthase [soil metagenome]
MPSSNLTPNHNLYAALASAFPTDRTRIAIEAVDPANPDAIGHGSHGRYTWDDLERGSAMMANLLESLQLPAGSRVAVQTEKSVEALMLYLAMLRTGLVYLPLNTAYRRAEIEYFIGDAEPAVVVCATANFTWVSKIAFKAGTAHVFTLGEDRSGTLLERALHHADSHDPVHRERDDLAVILYTSGTTGRSKGAMLSHGNMLSNARTLHELWAWRRDDVLIHVLPVFHIHGLFVAVNGALLAGACMIWFSRFDPAAVVSRLPEATVFMGVPTLYVRLLAEPGLNRQACSNMRLFVSGSAPLLLDTFEQFRERSGHTILERYGMSETVMLTSNPYAPADARRGGTVGFPLPGVDLRLEGVDPKAGDEIGSIEVHGPNVFAGYWRMPEKTAEAFTIDADGRRWFKTGDLGRIDADGYITIAGRSKDLIISGGYNVYPAEVEDDLNAMPGVAESAVIGLPHPDLGEAVTAVLIARKNATLDTAGIIADMKSRMAGFKVPKQVLLVEELPRNTMGKVQKNVLRESYGNLYGVS